MDVTSLSGRINGVNIIKEFQTGAVGRIEGVAVVTGICYMKMFWRFAGTKKSGCNNEVIVMRGSTVLRLITETKTFLSRRTSRTVHILSIVSCISCLLLVEDLT